MKSEKIDTNRLFGKSLNETDIYQVPQTDENGNTHMFSASQLATIYETMKPLLNAQELQDFNNMSPEDQEQYLTGFGANIIEWQKAKEAANNPNTEEQNPGMPGMQMPNDGLDHWQPVKKSQSKNTSSQSIKGNKVYSDIQEELDKAEQESQQAEQNASDKSEQISDISDPQSIANNANDIANSAQKMANAAQAAADAAQEAADQADENARESGNLRDIKNADKSQVAADAAQDLADQAQAAAERASKLAQQAQEAADNGNILEAERKTKEAFDAAKEASNKANAARVNAKDALAISKKTQSETEQNSDLQGSNQQGQDSEQNSQNNQQDDIDDEYTDPVLKKVDNKFNQNDKIIHKKPISMDMPFDGNDFVANDEEMRQKCREMAEQAGQPLDPDDYISPQEYANKKFQEARQALRKMTNNNPGTAGNPPGYIEEVLNKLFATTFDWREIVKEFMTDKSPENRVDAWSKRRMGLPDTHPFHKGRYLHPYEDFEEKRSGIAQVFFLVDASGSMSRVAADGVNIFKHIMSELIQLEMQVKIKRSAYATFNAGHIYRDDIFTWTYKDATDEKALMEEFKLPAPGGGTSAIQGIKSIQDYDDVYSTHDPWTLLIVITDGGDYYNGLKDICKDSEQVDHMLWIIMESPSLMGKNYFDKKIKELTDQGVRKDLIICIDLDKEWGGVDNKK